MTYERPSQEVLSEVSAKIQEMLHEVFQRKVLVAMVLIPEKSPDYLIMGEGFLNTESIKEALETAAEKLAVDDGHDMFTKWRRH